MSFIYIVIYFTLFLLLFFFVFIMQGNIPSPRLLYRTFGRDTRAAYRFLKLLLLCLKFRVQNANVGKLFQRRVKKHPHKSCFLFEDRVWTYQQVEDYSNQVANAFATAGYQKGDEVVLFMENRPEYVCIWLGLSKIGVVSALVNTNLRLQSLANSINAITPKAIILNANLAPAIKDAIPHMVAKSGVDFLCLDPIVENDSSSLHVTSLDFFLRNASKCSPDHTKYKINFTDKLFYIYTSGTTGLPKASVIKHSRYIVAGTGSKFVMKLREDDIGYVCLPLYHSSGSMIYLSNMLLFGGTMAMRTKFSASNFWKDVVKYKATVSQYIGEICRFLMNQSESKEETQHAIRLMIGNGLRPQLWKGFQERFCIPLIIEFYGSTEGNANLANLFGKAGAVGFISRLFPAIYPVNLIKVDPETCEPLRNKNQLCITCKPGEPGVIVGKISRFILLNSFEGYRDKKETNKKIITNCFKKGDRVFNSGDIVVMDEDGDVYFMDRTGDTFRWRGENVSTNEVEAIISKALSLTSCVVYGVKIPGTEGRAGMATIHSKGSIDMNEFYKSITSSLPTYAVPVFVRICKKLEATGTYKLKKSGLQKEGFNPTLTTDPIFMLDNQTRSYVRLSEEVYNSIMRHESKL